MGDDADWEAARAALKQRDYETAAEHLLAVVEQSDENADALNLLGCCYGQLGRYLEAEFYLSRACEVDPHLAHAHFNLGKCFEARHLIEMAIRSYENALRANRDYQQARAALEALHATLSPDLREETEEPEPDDEAHPQATSHRAD